MTGEPLGAFKTPLGAIELNVLLAGLEGAAAAWLAAVWIGNRPLIPALAESWNWSFAVWGVFILVGVILLGLAIEGVAGAFERWVTRNMVMSSDLGTPSWSLNLRTGDQHSAGYGSHHKPVTSSPGAA